jgi:hypothetical protein
VGQQHEQQAHMHTACLNNPQLKALAALQQPNRQAPNVLAVV